MTTQEIAPVITPQLVRGARITARDGTPGILLGGSRRCRLEGCTGRCYTVRWADGKLTYTCSKGLAFRAGVGHTLI